MTFIATDFKQVLTEEETQKEILKQLVLMNAILREAFDLEITMEECLQDAGYTE